MSIKIDHRGDGKYTALVSPPHSRQRLEAKGPIDAAQLVHALLEIGCHQTDIGDAFNEANPDWLLKR